MLSFNFTRTFLLLSSLLLSLASCASYSNALKDSEGGDPDIVYHDGYYYLMSTNFADLRQTRATTLEGLKTGETRLVHDPATAPEDARCQIWAPEMHLVDATWYIYYSAGPCSDCCGDQRSHVLKGGATPWDNFTYFDVIKTPAFAIDGTRLKVHEVDYFVYSCFRNDTGTSLQSLCISPFSSPSSIGEESLLASPTSDWETVGMPVNEGPYALYHKGKPYLTFSASYCGTTSYDIGLLTFSGGDPLDANCWSKSNGPVFKGTSNVTTTGHNSFFTSPDKRQTWITYHSTSNSAGSCGNDRLVNSKAIEFNSAGVPVFGIPPDYGVVLSGPSGE